ncbi:MAG: hypothetical protein JWQ27_251 [Ferruginibacter sp.]|nr:hypothetical protein [Ferruginibacter sp.]
MYSTENAIYNVILIASACLAVVIAFFIYTLVRQQKQSRAFNNMRVGVEIAQLENERKEIADELHDSFGPMIFATRMKLAAIQPGTATDRNLQAEGIAQLDKLTQTFRNYTRDLIPGSLLTKGLPTAVEEFFDGINQQQQLELSFNVTGIPEMAESATINIYRIIQEIIFNTQKHAKGSSVTVEAYCKGEEFIIATADDGRGFDYEAMIARAAGKGLKAIVNRVGLLGGDLQVQSITGKGTSYIISFPLKNLHG